MGLGGQIPRKNTGYPKKGNPLYERAFAGNLGLKKETPKKGPPGGEKTPRKGPLRRDC